MNGLHYNFDWSIAFRHPYSDWLLTGIKITLLLTVATSILSLCLGTLLAVMRQTRIGVLRALAGAYV
jgi:glutamate/aspartate transport system permease protein